MHSGASRITDLLIAVTRLDRRALKSARRTGITHARIPVADGRLSIVGSARLGRACRSEEQWRSTRLHARCAQRS